MRHPLPISTAVADETNNDLVLKVHSFTLDAWWFYNNYYRYIRISHYKSVYLTSP